MVTKHNSNHDVSCTGPLFTVGEFAGEVRVTPACTRRWLLLRTISSIKLGRLVRIPASERDRLLREGLRPARQPK
jgi:hypothetical protein